MKRPSYTAVDNADREAHIESRTDVLNKSFVTDLWMKVITRAIDDVALYQIMRHKGKILKEEDLENEASAKGFLFDDSHKIPMGDYLIDIHCPKCNKEWVQAMSIVVGQDSICPHCNHRTNRKYVDYTITEDQVIKDISLQDLIAIWGVNNIDSFREGVKDRVEEIIEKKLKAKTK